MTHSPETNRLAYVKMWYLTIITLLAATVAAQEPVLHEYGETSAVYMRPGDFPQILPQSPLEEEMRKAIKKLSPTVGVEMQFFLPLEKDRLHAPEFPQELYNILHKTTALKGVEYYSASGQKMGILFQEAWTINNPREKLRIPDRVFTSIPAEDSGYSYVDTGTYGKVFYNIRYVHQTGHYWIAFTNENPLRAGVFTVARRGNFQMYILISPAEEGLHIYANTILFNIFLSKNNPFIPVEKIQTSLRNRVRALFVWLKDQLTH